LSCLDQHFENRLADLNAQHGQERQQINPAEDPIGDEILAEKQERELSNFERGKENAEPRLESIIDGMCRDGVAPGPCAA